MHITLHGGALIKAKTAPVLTDWKRFCLFWILTIVVSSELPLACPIFFSELCFHLLLISIHADRSRSIQTGVINPQPMSGRYIQ